MLLYVFVVTLLCSQLNVSSANVIKEHHVDGRHHHPLHSAGRLHVHHRTQKLHTRSQTNNSIELLYTESTHLLALFKNSSNVSLIFDVASSLLLLRDNNSTLILETLSQSLLTINNQTAANLDNLITANNSLQSLAKTGEPLKNLTKIDEIGKQIGLNTNTLQYLQTASLLLNRFYNNSLVTLLFQQEKRLVVQEGLPRFLRFLNGLADLGGRNATSLQPPPPPPFSLGPILNAPSGIETFIKLLEALIARFNILTLVGDGLKNTETVIEIIVRLKPDDARNGIDNILKLIHDIKKVVSGRMTIDEFIRALIEVTRNRRNFHVHNLDAIIRDLGKIERQSGVCSNLVKLLEQLRGNSLSVHGVDVSKLIEMIRAGNFRNAIEVITHVLLNLGGKISPTTTIPNFFSHIIRVFNSSNGDSLAHLVPGLDPARIRDVIQRCNVSDLLNNQTISNIPGIGQIYQTISSALQNSNHLWNPANNSGIFPFPFFPLPPFLHPPSLPEPINNIFPFNSLFGRPQQVASTTPTISEDSTPPETSPAEQESSPSGPENEPSSLPVSESEVSEVSDEGGSTEGKRGKSSGKHHKKEAKKHLNVKKSPLHEKSHD